MNNCNKDLQIFGSKDYSKPMIKKLKDLIKPYMTTWKHWIALKAIRIEKSKALIKKLLDA